MHVLCDVCGVGSGRKVSELRRGTGGPAAAAGGEAGEQSRFHGAHPQAGGLSAGSLKALSGSVPVNYLAKGSAVSVTSMRMNS